MTMMACVLVRGGGGSRGGIQQLNETEAENGFLEFSVNSSSQR